MNATSSQNPQQVLPGGVPPTAPDCDDEIEGQLDLKAGGVPRRYPDLVQLYAVLVPMFGRLGDDDSIIAATKKLRAAWRARVMALAEAGWPGLCGDDSDARRNRHYALSCKPSFVITPEKSMCCRHRAVCPFCWARGSREAWLKIERAFFDGAATRGRSRYVLVERSVSVVFPHRVDHDLRGVPLPDGREDALPMFLKQRAAERGSAFRNPGILAAFETLHISGRPRHQWDVSIRQILMTTPGFAIPESVEADSDRVSRVERPGRRDVLNAVARAARFPTFLMRGKPSHVLSYLGARRGRKVSTMIGRFRNGSAIGINV